MNKLNQWNNKGWVARDYVIALILFSGVIALAYIMVGSLSTDYNTPGVVNSDFSEHYNKLNENTADAQNMLESVSSSGGLSIIGTFEILLSSTFTVVNIILGGLGNVASQVASIPADFGIPTEVTSILFVIFLSIITVSIVFIIINAVNKTNKM